MSIKIGKNAKSVVLENGVEIDYCEFGQDNEEVLITGAFYFHTYIPFLEELSKKYHVYGIVMRTDGKTTKTASDGEINWAEQWGDDIVQFAKHLDISHFIYLGKCHGTVPGWHILENYPQMLDGLVVMSLVPQTIPPKPLPKFMKFMQLQMTDIQKSTEMTVRKKENVEKKIRETQTLQGGMTSVRELTHMQPLSDIKSTDKLIEFYQNIDIPVLLTYGLEDPGYDSELVGLFMNNIPRLKAVFYQGERHLYEMDIPIKLAEEVKFFFEQTKDQ